jgi:putative phage-type endonuclease
VSTQADWLADRRTGIGSSEIAAVFGVSPYLSAYQLWADKSGLAENVVTETEAMAWGKRLEPIVAAEFAARTGYEVELNGHQIHRSAAHPWLIATPDAIITRPDGSRGVLEIKVASGFADGWEEELPPMHYRLQIAHQMLALGLGWGSVCCFDGAELRLKVWECILPTELGKAIIARGSEFWSKVELARSILTSGNLGTGKLREVELSLGPTARDVATIQRVHSGGKDVADLSEHEQALLEWAGGSARAKQVEEAAMDAKAKALVHAGEADMIVSDGRTVAKKDKRGAWRLNDDYRSRALEILESRRASA